MKNIQEKAMPDLHAAAKRTKGMVAYHTFTMPEEAEQLGEGKKYFIHTYGCQANVRDSETLAGLLEQMSFQAAEKDDVADLVIFNTCAVRKNAEEHVFGNLGQLKSWRAEHPDAVIAVCGCMVQEEAVVHQLLESYPQVDLIFGTHNLYRLPYLLLDYEKTHERTVEVFSEEGDVMENLPVRRNDPYRGYVNIMYGCNKFCTYCIVPYTRGKERSRHMEDILAEVRQLKETGHREVILLGQNVNAYGKDLGMEDGFTALLEAVAETGIERIRFYTSHPRDYSFNTILAMKKYPNIMKALHLPVQSGSDAVLKRMNRGYTAEQYLQLVADMKREIPDITFTTDLIVGFPEESDEDFQKTMDLVDACQFDAAFTFIYSPREGTPAAKFEDHISSETKKERLAALNEKVAYYGHLNNQKYLNRTLKVLCEGPSKKNPDVYMGYSEENKLVNFTGPAGLEGKTVDVKITKALSFSLNGEAL
jgi:tRNA-2-methylthio-N6-dimethylallyladenosine synthase